VVHEGDQDAVGRELGRARVVAADDGGAVAANEREGEGDALLEGAVGREDLERADVGRGRRDVDAVAA
jgi:hypothetical protein